MTPLVAEKFLADPRLDEAKRLVLAALADHQGAIAGPRSADPARKVSYEQAISRFADLRAGALFFPYLGSGIGRGPLVELADGSVKYDMISGIGVHHFGHGNPALVEAALNAAVQDTIMQGNLQQGVESPRLSEVLVEAACRRGAKLTHCFVTSSGAMANENALKMIFQKKSPASRILAFENCFMGRTLALSQVTDNSNYREGLPVNMSVDYIPFFSEDNPDASTRKALAALQGYLTRYPRQHAVMCVELVQGEGGYYPGDRAFFQAVIDVLRQHNVAVLVDEVQTFGRTSELFAFQHFGLDAAVDVVTIGKLSQACATLFTDEYKPRPGLISQTFTDSTSAIVAAQVIVRSLINGDFFGPNGRNATVHQHFAEFFQAIAARHPTWIKGPFGLGAMVAFTPFNGEAEVAKKVVQTMFINGVIAFVAGHGPTRVRLLPPIPALAKTDIDDVCRTIEVSLAQVAASR